MSRRKRSPHPGVRIRRRKLKNGTLYSYRYTDPLSGKVIEKKFDRHLYKDDLERRARAKEISDRVLKERDALASGIAATESTPISNGIQSFVSYCKAIPRRKPTLIKYQYAAKYFCEWIGKIGIKDVEKINYQSVKGFIEYLYKQQKKAPQPGGKAGERRPTDERLTTSTIDGIARSVKAILRYWRGKGQLRLTNEEIQGALKMPEKRSKFVPRYFKPNDCRQLLEAALQHDEETIAVDEHDARRLRFLDLASARRAPVAYIVLFFLLSGFRLKEVRNLKWSRVNFDAVNSEGKRIGEIVLTSDDTKTSRYRTVGLDVCPSLLTLLSILKLHAGKDEFVFGGSKPLGPSSLSGARDRLIKNYGVRKFTWQHLRQTTSTYLTNAPGIYGAASVFLSAAQMGHSVAIAEQNYVGVERGISREARTLEQAMQVEDLAKKILDRVSSRTFAVVRELFVAKTHGNALPSQ